MKQQNNNNNDKNFIMDFNSKITLKKDYTW